MIYECHGHMAMDSINFKAAMERHKNGVDKEFVRRNFKACLESGVRFYRDGGDKYMVSAYAKTIAEDYGIDYRTPIFAIHKKGYYGDIVGKSFINMKDFAALVKEAKALGADFIKIMVSGILSFKTDGTIEGPALTFEELREAVNIASCEGFSVMAHVNGADNIIKALEAGVKSVEHGFWPDNRVINAFIKSGAVWVPTCSTVRNLIGTEGFSETVLEQIIEKQSSVLSEAFSKGVLIACGSDCGAINVPQGRGTLDELSYLKKLGIAPEQANKKISDTFKI